MAEETGPIPLSAVSRELRVPPSLGERGHNEALPFLICCGFLSLPVSPLLPPLPRPLPQLRASTGPSVRCPLIDTKQDVRICSQEERTVSPAGAFQGLGLGRQRLFRLRDTLSDKRSHRRWKSAAEKPMCFDGSYFKPGDCFKHLLKGVLRI